MRLKYVRHQNAETHDIIDLFCPVKTNDLLELRHIKYLRIVSKFCYFKYTKLRL